MSLNRRQGLALVGALVMSNLAARTLHAAPPDEWITTKIRIALLTTDGAGRTDVKVTTEHGKVTLQGKVENQATKSKAEDTARGVDGVTGVRNLVQVVPEYSKHAVKASDHEIKEAVEAALKGNKSLEGIKVDSVDNALVVLDGHTKTLEHKLMAIETAYGCKGVRQVASRIETADHDN